MDAIHCNVRDNGAVVKKAVYIVLAYTMDGLKEVLGMYVGENESSIVRPFIESINVVNYLYNQPMEILIDKENVYLAEVAV